MHKKGFLWGALIAVIAMMLVPPACRFSVTFAQAEQTAVTVDGWDLAEVYSQSQLPRSWEPEPARVATCWLIPAGQIANLRVYGPEDEDTELVGDTCLIWQHATLPGLSPENVEVLAEEFRETLAAQYPTSRLDVEYVLGNEPSLEPFFEGDWTGGDLIAGTDLPQTWAPESDQVATCWGSNKVSIFGPEDGGFELTGDACRVWRHVFWPVDRTDTRSLATWWRGILVSSYPDLSWDTVFVRGNQPGSDVYRIALPLIQR